MAVVNELLPLLCKLIEEYWPDNVPSLVPYQLDRPDKIVARRYIPLKISSIPTERRMLNVYVVEIVQSHATVIRQDQDIKSDFMCYYQLKYCPYDGYIDFHVTLYRRPENCP